MLKITCLSTGYRNRAIIEDVTLRPLEKGTMTALIGPNATGKTTFLKALAGLKSARGSICLDGKELLAANIEQYAQAIAYMPQSLPQRVSLTVLDAVLSALNASPVGRMRREEAPGRAFAALERLGIQNLANRRLDELSGGQRQLASLAQAIAREPAVLLLDEPTSALDPAHQFRVMNTVKAITTERRMVSVVVLHDLALACRWCDRIVVMSEGKIAADGPPAEAITTGILADVYGIRASLGLDSGGFLSIHTEGLIGL